MIPADAGHSTPPRNRPLEIRHADAAHIRTLDEIRGREVMDPRAGQFRLEPSSARIECDGGADVHATRVNGSKVQAPDIDQLQRSRDACRNIRGGRRPTKNSIGEKAFGRQQSRGRWDCDRLVDVDSPIVCSQAQSRRAFRLEPQTDVEGIRARRLQVRIAARAHRSVVRIRRFERDPQSAPERRPAACGDRRAAADGSFGPTDVRRVSADIGRQISAYSGLKVWPTSE